MKISANLVWAIVALFLGTLAAVVVLVAFVGVEGSAALVTGILANVGTIVAVLANFQRTGVVETKVEQVATDTHSLVNGLLDAKVRAGVADVVQPHLIDPDAELQLERDRIVRDQAHSSDELRQDGNGSGWSP